MSARRILLLCAIALVPALALYAQFGGLINKAKSKIDRANEKAKPVTTRAEKAAGLDDWSDEDEQMIGEAGAAKMIALWGLIDDPKISSYINLVGSTVARNAPRQLPYRFGVLDVDIVGAFALPGGFVFVTRGALEAMDDEAELAGALGHEIIHCAERHLEREVRSKNATAWIADEAKSRTTREPAFFRQRADTLLKGLFDTKLSRDKEDGADIRGAKLAADAGYAPDGLIRFLRALANAKSEKAARAKNQLLSTHPPFEERIAHLESGLDTKARGQTNQARFKAALK